MQLSNQIAAGTIAPARTCTPPPIPPGDLSGKTGSKNDYKGASPTTASVADDTIHADVARAHMGILRTAFACDLIRVATFQFSPGTNHVSFKGLYPDNPNGIYMHHPTSHVIMTGGDVTGSGPPSSGDNLVNRQSVVQFLINVQTWYNRLMAELLVGFKTSTDVFGGNLLDNTIIPFVTEVAHTVHSHSPMPAMIFGGSKLGMRGGQFVNLNNTSTNAMWLSIAQALFKTANPLDRLPATTEKFVRNSVAPIPNLWAMPP
jgi:hypothetical protein